MVTPSHARSLTIQERAPLKGATERTMLKDSVTYTIGVNGVMEVLSFSEVNPRSAPSKDVRRPQERKATVARTIQACAKAVA